MSERLPRIQPEFIVIIASAWMNESWHGIHYSFDGARFNNRSDAIMHGWKSCGSDDFNIGQTYGDDLIWFGWMSERIDEPDDTMRHIANDCGLTFNPKWARLDLSKVTGAVIGWRTPAPPHGPAPMKRAEGATVSEPLLSHEVQALMFLLHGPDTPGTIDSDEKFAAVLVFDGLRRRGFVISDIGRDGPTYRLTREGKAIAEVAACAVLANAEPKA